MAHLYASFADASLAEKAAGALLDFGVRQEDISLVANDQYGQTRDSYATTAGDTGVGATGAYGAEGTSAGYGTAAADPALGTGGLGTGQNVGVYNNPAVGTSADLNPLDQGGTDSYASEGDVETAAKHGISTTTPEDAGAGAVKGTGIGLGVGILASLAALTIPGVGLVLGGGALAAALGATALTAGAGALAGGATGYLKEQGVPADAAERYHGTVTSGGAVLSLNIPSGKVDEATAGSILSKYGASDLNTY
ncbi:MAG: hypothetical protein ACRYFS_04830 [Janthinobacterium lividum]